MPLPMWSVGQAQDYINKRVEKHRAEAANPPVCNKRERWQRDAKFALMKRGAKRAIRLFENEDMAEAAAIQMGKAAPPGQHFYVESRQAEPVRCLDFCAVQTYCDFGTAAQEKFDKSQKTDEEKPS